ncbi:MAG: CinA family nicotinamide mononucleotide deamidase-related protein [Rikenellaceae bacterium]|nr:CinA family nicotinamide mononucleotide deamidase-related protein [Rikenellaceae bacterium]
MKASVITIGDEILIGQVVDTNSAWIARRLSDTGAEITAKFTVGDKAVDIVKALDDALALSDAVILTGGLGPTRDDITKKTLAAYFGMELQEDPQVLADIDRMLASRNIPLNDLNRGQATVPVGCTILHNRNGTAPGMWFERGGKVAVSLPGVPFEMESLMESDVLPRLHERFGRGDATYRTVHTSGIAESVLAEKIAGWENSLPAGVQLAYLPSTSGVRLRLSSYGLPSARAGQIIEERVADLRTILGAYLLEEGQTDPALALAKLLTTAQKSLSAAESCTGGRIAGMITAHPGASDYFLGGVVAYSTQVKTGVLGIDPQIIEKYGVVSEPTARAMAEGARDVTGSDYAVSTTGYAGPDGGGDQPVGTVWIGIAFPGGSYARKVRFGKLRGPNIERASATALNLLRLYLAGEPDKPIAGGVF